MNKTKVENRILVAIVILTLIFVGLFSGTVFGQTQANDTTIQSNLEVALWDLYIEEAPAVHQANYLFNCPLQEETIYVGSAFEVYYQSNRKYNGRDGLKVYLFATANKCMVTLDVRNAEVLRNFLALFSM